MKERVHRIFQQLSPAPDALLLVNSIEPHLDQSFFYVFDVPGGLFEGSSAFAQPDGSLHVTTTSLEEETALQAAKHDPHVDVHLIKNKEDGKKWLAKMLPPTGTVGLNFHELTHEDFLAVSAAAPGVKWIDASAGIRRARRVKDPVEVKALREAARIGSVVGEEIPSLLRKGITESELASEIEYRMMRLGASGRSFSSIVGFGAHSAEPHYQPSSTKLEPGMSIVCDFGAFYHRYASDITRSFRFGPADAELKRVHETVEQAQQAAFDLIQPGVPGKAVHLAAQKVIDATPWKGRFTHGLGHSIGLSVHDGFGMADTTEDLLEAGMAITVEPGIYLPGKGGVRIEDDILVTEKGFEFLTTTRRGYLEVPA